MLEVGSLGIQRSGAVVPAEGGEGAQAPDQLGQDVDALGRVVVDWLPDGEDLLTMGIVPLPSMVQSKVLSSAYMPYFRLAVAALRWPSGVPAPFDLEPLILDC